MNGKPRDMNYKFAIQVLQHAKVDTPAMSGNPKRYGYQNQYFYDIARSMAIQALKEKYENSPKVYSRWVYDGKPIHCMACGYEPTYSLSPENALYCPHCGVEMEG